MRGATLHRYAPLMFANVCVRRMCAPSMCPGISMFHGLLDPSSLEHFKTMNDHHANKYRTSKASTLRAYKGFPNPNTKQTRCNYCRPGASRDKSTVTATTKSHLVGHQEKQAGRTRTCYCNVRMARVIRDASRPLPRGRGRAPRFLDLVDLEITSQSSRISL